MSSMKLNPVFFICIEIQYYLHTFLCQVSNPLYDVQSRWHNIVIPDMYSVENSKPLLQPLTKNHQDSIPKLGGSYIFFALEPNTNFEVRIQARNSYGWGRFSDIFLFSTTSKGNRIFTKLVK